jgi:hypothetical protein
LGVFYYRLLRRINERKPKEVTEYRRKEGERGGGCTALGGGGIRNTDGILVRIPEKERSVRATRRRCNNIKMDISK